MPPPPNKRQKREDYRKAHQETQSAELPKKKFYRQRAHANPFSDHQLTYPRNPAAMDWSTLYPAYAEPASEQTATGQGEGEVETHPVRKLRKPITVADIGCGFGGLLIALSTKLPDELILGLEIRTQVLDYVTDRISALRHQHLLPAPTSPAPTPYDNIAALRANTMKFLPNFFPRHALSKLFLCFPDPHFKNRKKKMRIVSRTLCAEYAYVVRPGGHVFTITDVEELAGWMEGAFERSGGEGGERVWEKVVCGDAAEVWTTRGEGAGGLGERGEVDEKGGLGAEVEACVEAMLNETEEGKKVTRVGGKKFIGVWRRREDPPWPS